MKINSPFGPGVGFSCVSASQLENYLPHPEEGRILSSNASKKRRVEFFLGRLAAFRAIKALGISPQPVLKGRQREPQWQDGVIGSIAHKEDTAIAAVALKSTVGGIGIDLEGLDRPVSVRILAKVCTESERDWVLEIPEKIDTRLKMIFSAKEAGFKAFFPVQQIYLNYRDAELFWYEDAQSFKGILLKSAARRYPIGSSFEVGCRISGRFLFSFITLSPSLGDM